MVYEGYNLRALTKDMLFFLSAVRNNTREDAISSCIELEYQNNKTIQYTLFNEGEHINLLQFSNIWPSKINSNRQKKNINKLQQ